MRKVILLFFVSFFCQAALAQSPYVSRLGYFQVDQKKGCAPFTVTITDYNLKTTGQCSGTAPCSMYVDGVRLPNNNTFTFLFPNPGTFKIGVLYGSLLTDDITITVDQNIPPEFDIYSCAGNKAQIKLKDNNYFQYVIDFDGDGTPETVIPPGNNATATFNYLTPGNKTINIRGRNSNSADNCTPGKSQSFIAVTTPLPATTINTLATVDASNIKLDFSTQPNIQYRSEIAVNTGIFQQYQTVFGVNTLVVPNLKVDDNYYCFRLSSYDPCANANTYSNTICSQNFDLNIKSAVNTLNWTTATTGISSMTFERKKNNVTELKLTRPGASPLSINDTDAICKTDYCYTLISNYSNGAKSISLEKCGTAFNTNTPPAINNVSSIVSDPGVELTWLLDPKIIPVGFKVSRSILSGTSILVGETPDKKFNDPAYQTSFNFCYAINYTDNCSNLSAAGALVCPLRLYGSLDNKNITYLNWSRYTGWSQGVKNYTVEKYGLGNTLIKKFDVGTDTLLVDDQPDPKNQFVSYKIVATSVETGLTTSISNTLSFVKETHLISPTAFTPNGDNLNDTFTVMGEFIVKIELSIFDRWGALIFNTKKCCYETV